MLTNILKRTKNIQNRKLAYLVNSKIDSNTGIISEITSRCSARTLKGKSIESNILLRSNDQTIRNDSFYLWRG